MARIRNMVRPLQPDEGDHTDQIRAVLGEVERIGISEQQAGEKGVTAVELFRQAGAPILSLRFGKNFYWAMSYDAALRLLKSLPDDDGIDGFWDTINHKREKSLSEHLSGLKK